MSDATNWTASDLQAALVRKAARGKVGAPPQVLSAPTRRTAIALQKYIMHYDADDPENPDDIEDDDMYQILFSGLETLTAWDATRSGDVSSMRGVAGAPESERVDASKRSLTDEVRELFKPEDRDHMLNLVIYAPPPPKGPTGVGKTDFAYSIIEDGIKVYIPYGGLSPASNNTSDPFPDVQTWTELEEWLKATNGPKVFLWDEAAQTLMFDDMDSGKALSNLIKLLRKYNCHLIVIGHTGKDIPKDVRRMVLFCLKESKYSASVGAGLEEDSAGWMQIKNVLTRFKNITKTGITYESIGDKGYFKFDKESDDEVEVADIHQCEAETNAGNPCPNDAKFPPDDSRVCVNHRHKLDDLDSSDEDEQGDEGATPIPEDLDMDATGEDAVHELAK